MDIDFKTQVDATYKNLYYFALSLSKNEADAADLTQQAYLKLAKNWKKIRDKTKSKSWLFSTLYREFLDKKKRNKFNVDVSFDIATEQLEDDRLPPNNLDYETILAALMDLDDKLRIPLTLFYLESYTYRQISEILLIPIGTVMSRMHRGKQSLYQELTNAAPLKKLSYS